MATVVQRTGKMATAQAASVTTYYFAGCGASSLANTTETSRQVTVRTAGTTSMMTIMVTANDRGTSTLRMRKNTANGNQVVTITASTTGKFEDVSNTDALVATDVFNYQLVTGAGGSTFNFNAMSHLFASGTNTSQRLVCSLAATIGNNDELPLTGVQSGSAIAGNQLKIYGNGGTFKNLALYVSANTRDADCTVTLRKAAVSQTLTVTIPTTTTGLFEDTSNTVAAVNGDLFDWLSVRPGTTGSCTVQYIACDFETTDRTFYFNSSGSITPVAASTVYFTISASNSVSSATETDAQTEARAAYTLSNLRVFTASNTVVGDSTFNLRKNTADATLTVTITSLTAGAFEDVTHTDSVVASDVLDYKLVVGGAGTSLIIRNTQMLATLPATGTTAFLTLLGAGT